MFLKTILKFIRFKYFNFSMESNKFTKTQLLTYNYVKPKLKNEIELTEKEKEIFSVVKNVLAKNNKNTICRVAGGWVRDKVKIKNFIKLLDFGKKIRRY